MSIVYLFEAIITNFGRISEEFGQNLLVNDYRLVNPYRRDGCWNVKSKHPRVAEPRVVAQAKTMV